MPRATLPGRVPLTAAAISRAPDVSSSMARVGGGGMFSVVSDEGGTGTSALRSRGTTALVSPDLTVILPRKASIPWLLKDDTSTWNVAGAVSGTVTSSDTVSCSVESSVKTCGSTRSLPWACNRISTRAINPGSPGWTCRAWAATNPWLRAALSAWGANSDEYWNCRDRGRPRDAVPLVALLPLLPPHLASMQSSTINSPRHRSCCRHLPLIALL